MILKKNLKKILKKIMTRLYTISDKELIANAEIILECFKEDLTSFTTINVSMDLDFVDKLEKSIQKLNNNISNVQQINDEQILELNSLFNLISEIKNVAKYIFSDNPSKLSRYINMNKNISLPDKPKKLEYFHATEEFKWEPSENSALYQLQFAFESTETETNWEEAVMTPVSNIHFVPEKAGDYKFRVIGFNGAGFGEPSDIVEMYFGKY